MKIENLFPQIINVSDDCKLLLEPFSVTSTVMKIQSKAESFVDFPLAAFEGRVISHRFLSNCFFMQSMSEAADESLSAAYIFRPSSVETPSLNK